MSNDGTPNDIAGAAVRTLAPGVVTLSPATRAELRAVARAREGEAAERAAALVVAEARGRSITAEHMIIAVKHEWAAMADVRELRSAGEARALLDRLVTRCIDAFYARRPADPR